MEAVLSNKKKVTSIFPSIFAERRERKAEKKFEKIRERIIKESFAQADEEHKKYIKTIENHRKKVNKLKSETNLVEENFHEQNEAARQIKINSKASKLAIIGAGSLIATTLVSAGILSGGTALAISGAAFILNLLGHRRSFISSHNATNGLNSDYEMKFREFERIFNEKYPEYKELVLQIENDKEKLSSMTRKELKKYQKELIESNKKNSNEGRNA